jgi:hypothetical protein
MGHKSCYARQCGRDLTLTIVPVGPTEDLRWQALYVVIRYDLHPTVEYLIARKLAATPVDVLLVASLCKNGQRNKLRRLIRSLEPTEGKDNLNVLPSSLSLQFVRKL